MISSIWASPLHRKLWLCNDCSRMRYAGGLLISHPIEKLSLTQ